MFGILVVVVVVVVVVVAFAPQAPSARPSLCRPFRFCRPAQEAAIYDPRMLRFGEFTVLEDLGRSASAERYKVSHAVQGGPFFLKVYRGLSPALRADWLERAQRLVGKNHPYLAGLLSHGVVDDVPYSLSPWLEGLDIPTLAASLKERRVHLGFEHCFVIVSDLALAVAAAHEWVQTAQGPLLVHGEVTTKHVRLGTEGQVWLTGLVTPRGPGATLSSEHPYDLAGVAACLYDLVPLLRGGSSRSALPTVLDRVLRRALAIGPSAEHLTPRAFVDRLADAAETLKVKPDRAGLADVVHRTMRALEKKNATQRAPDLLRPAALRGPADDIPELVPVRAGGKAPSAHLPVGTGEKTHVGRHPASLIELQPLAPQSEPPGPGHRSSSSPAPVSGAVAPGGGPAAPRPLPAQEQPSLVVPPPVPLSSPAPVALRIPSIPPTAAGVAPGEDTPGPAPLQVHTLPPALRAVVEAGAATLAQVAAGMAEQAQRGGRVLETLVGQGVLTDDLVAKTLATASGRPLLSSTELAVPIDRGLLRRVPRTYALAHRLLPLQLTGGTLALAMADPFDRQAIDEVGSLLHVAAVDVRVASRTALTQATLAAFGAAGSDAAKGPRILLCLQDDERAQHIGARLAQEGMQVEHVVEGTAARQILSTRPPHAVLCAVDLPAVDGRTLLLFVRAQETLAELPFFVVGPRGDDELVARMLDFGADDFFTEPLRTDLVVAKLRRVASKRAELTAATSAPAPVLDVVARASPAPLLNPLADDFSLGDFPDLPPEVLSAPPAAMEVEAPAMPTGVMGTLRQMSLPEIVQSLEMGRKTASVDIVPQEGEKGRIAFLQGAIKFAETGALEGEAAFFELMRHRDGFFRIHYGDAPRVINIQSPTTFLLLEAMRLMDEGAGG